MIYIIILILIIVVSFLSVKLLLIKRQLRRIALTMQEQDEGLVSVDFADKDLESVALQINKKLEQMQQAKAESAKNEQAMKTSISMISHDMRTPLTSVIGYLQLAQKSCTDEEALQHISVALDRARYATKLVDDFFELSVVDSDSYTPIIEKINLCEVVCEELLANYPNFENKGITPVFEQADGTVWVQADRKFLTRIIQNLISNGIKYSTGKMEFVITESEKTTLAVSNTISEAVDTRKIFDRFYRADISRSGEGAGLGLYICRKLAEEMGGNIFATESKNKLTVKLELMK